jgi:ankyrin repeat protein
MNPLLWQYFKQPFPKAEGFSAYRMPGVAVHLPVMLIFAWIGWWAASAGGMAAWSLPLYLVLGLYVGRDVAIIAHYNPLITILVWVSTAALFYGGRPPPAGVLGGAALTITILVLFCFYLRWWIGREDFDALPRLHLAIQSKRLKAVRKALEEGADVNQKDTPYGWGHTPLHLAIEMATETRPAQIIPIIDLLIDHGADLDAPSGNEETPLRLALEAGMSELALHLLSRGADVDGPGKYGMTPLHAAVARGDRSLISTLLAAGANIKYRPENRTDWYRGLLGQAACFAQWDLIPWLIEHGAQADADEPWLRSAAASDDPLALTAVQCLIDAGVAVDNELLLYDAATPEMQQLLIRNGAKIDPDSNFKASVFLNHDGHRAKRLNTLIALGCNLAAADKYGETFLHLLTKNVDDALTLPELWPVLKDAGIDVNAPDAEGVTALHSLVTCVLPHVTGRNIVGLTHQLPVEDAIRPLDILLDAGANPRLKNAAGEDAIAISRRLKAPKAFLRRLEAVP